MIIIIYANEKHFVLIKILYLKQLCLVLQLNQLFKIDIRSKLIKEGFITLHN